MTEVAVAYLHVVGFVTLASVLLAEALLLSAAVQAREVVRVARLDFCYMLAAVLVLATGLLRVVWFGKGAAFYLHNPVFWIKLALFAAVGLISIPPTMRFLRWKRALSYAQLPDPRDVAQARRYVFAELSLLPFIPLAAVLMARGIGIQA
jgi:putative membrane protein